MQLAYLLKSNEVFYNNLQTKISVFLKTMMKIKILMLILIMIFPSIKEINLNKIQKIIHIIMFLRIKYHKLFCTLNMEQQKKTSFVRRDKLISLEQRARNIWDRYQYFSVEPNEKPKFFQTFPYAYMNGLLHLGHAFSMTKCDFNAWYKRLNGYNVLFPFGFHCTGMPICAAAIKLNNQLQLYGNPPKFPQDRKPIEFQYNLLRMMNIPEDQIQKFKDPRYWVKYFPPLGRVHLNKFGVHVDNARSFITTDMNPYYNSFIQWQFIQLKQKGYINFGRRPSIYSPKDKQMCADHDRSKGEGVGPDEYTLIKIEVTQMNEAMKKAGLEGRKVFLTAATLRPETMYGQTCCYLLPDGQYCAVEMKNNEVFICSERSARNMAYQNLTKQDEKIEIICKLKGSQMMGISLKAPLAIHQKIYTLPMMTISMNKGTGVVTCVPSDSPDDWMAISDLRKKAPMREKYGITEAMVNLDPVEIINIPTYGNLSALTVCQNLKIKSQNDRVLLDQAKDQCYKKGFHEGTMVIGNYKGQKVADAKNLVRKELIENGSALKYYEPGGQVVSRSGDECVVSYCDQWYINYGHQEWQKKVLNYVQTQFKCNSEVLHNDLIYTVNWLKEWGCSRSFGLGTKLPFDNQYLIESLSDSTIYFAFYTFAHLLQGNLDGSEVGVLGIRHEEITPDFWDFVLLGKQYTSKKIPQYKLDKVRESFLYWYPMDLRCSAKDLIKNHLTMALYNHVAIWDDPKFWPQAYYCNGYILVEGQKMSKSAGNFITLIDAVQQYGADSTRLACALAGDSINDANFTKQNANAAIIQLSTFQMFMNKCLQQRNTLRKKQQQSPYGYFDQIFESQMEEQIMKVKQAYEKMVYRDVVKYGFHDFTGLKDLYILNCENKPRADLIERYLYYQLLFLYPICPHFCEVSYIDHFLSFAENSKAYPQLIGSCSFPKPHANINYGAVRSHQYIIKFLAGMRQNLTRVSKPKKGQEPPKYNKATIIYRANFQPFQIQILKLLRTCIHNGEIKPDWRTNVTIQNKDQKTRALKFGGFIQKQYKVGGNQTLQENLPFDQRKVLEHFIPIIKRDFPMDIQIVQVQNAPKNQNKNWKQTLNGVTPGTPTVVFQ